MILDTTFLSALMREIEADRVGSAKQFLAKSRRSSFFTTTVNVAELAVYCDPGVLETCLSHIHILPLHEAAAIRAGEIDRMLIDQGKRMGEADTLIAGIAMYNSQPLVSNDLAFDRVRGLRRIKH